jgi:hypothetical protein
MDPKQRALLIKQRGFIKTSLTRIQTFVTQFERDQVSIKSRQDFKDYPPCGRNTKGCKMSEFVGLLECHDKPHMSRWVRGVNMELECALWTAYRSHIGLIDV